MRFGPSNASSVDLCVRDLIAASRYRKSTTVVCCQNETLFPGLKIETYPLDVDAHKSRKVAFAIAQASKASADLVVVQQHLPTAAALARRVAAPVILHKHNMTRPIAKDGLLSGVRRNWRLRQYGSLAGIIFVSNACRAAFRRDWPEVQTPSSIVYNGLDFTEWRPSRDRANEIICVGRAAPEKGIREAALAIATVLAVKKSWRARLVLSEAKRFPGYLNVVLATIRPLAARVTVEYDLPLSSVRQRCQNAAIAIVPSKWEEPFGRTALEAHASGCAVISSSSGGLPEVNGDNALALPEGFNCTDIAACVERLIEYPGLRMKLAQQGRAYCLDKFAISRVATSADDFYDRIIRSREDLRSSKEERAEWIESDI
jgi:glycosyltransferase involved in cell wall biosynthesis